MRSVLSIGVAGLLAAGLLAAAPNANADNPTLTISGTSEIIYGSSGVVTAHLTNDLGAPISHAVLQLWVRPVLSRTEREVGTATTNSSGVASLRVSPHVNVVYHWIYIIFDTPTAIAAERSAGLTMRVAARVSVATSTPNTSSFQAPITLYGTVGPSDAGLYVQLEFRVGTSTSWTLSSVRALIKSQRLPNGVTEVGYVMTFNLPYTQYRVYRAATATNVAGASARVLVVTS